MNDKPRCLWCLKDNLYRDYHDLEWGEPSHDDRHLFEHHALEIFQAGLSWHTILKRREHFNQAFEGFDPEMVAQFDERKKEALLANPGIIRNRAKIKAVVNNAGKVLEIQSEFGSFARYAWQFTGHKVLVRRPAALTDYPVSSPESLAMSRDMKKRGFSFVGPTGCYAFMQAVGMVNEHMAHCWKAG
jgi:DNA-3-methyladenine glycosylase I